MTDENIFFRGVCMRDVVHNIHLGKSQTHADEHTRRDTHTHTHTLTPTH